MHVKYVCMLVCIYVLGMLLSTHAYTHDGVLHPLFPLYVAFTGFYLLVASIFLSLLFKKN